MTVFASSTDESILCLKGVGVTYAGEINALHPQDLEVRKGEVTVLLGRSGAGKSTLLRAMNLLVEPTVGTVSCPTLGPLTGVTKIREHRRRTGMVFQQHQLIGRQSALTNVLTSRLSRYSTLRSLFALPLADRELALSCLDRVGLLGKALQRVDQLSGGQQQRVGVARALAMEPTLILADEPVASLDPATSRQLLSLMRDICRLDGITLVISLHQVEFAKEFGDRIIALSDGHIVFNDVPEKLDEAALESIYENEVETDGEDSEASIPAPPLQEGSPVAATVR